MRHRTRLPRRLGERFTVRTAESAGVRAGRYSAPDLHRPFHGVRSVTAPATFTDHLECCVLRLKPGQRFGGITGVRHWGLPTSSAWTPNEAIVVIAPTGTTPPKTRGVDGRRLKPERATTMILKGVPVVDPVAALFTCAADLTLIDAVVMIDALITTAMNYPHLGPGRPMSTLDDIERRLEEWRQFPGCKTIRAALRLARERVESPKETETRLLIVASGLPEPVVQYEVYDENGELIARPDLAYPELKIAIEYDGDGHRLDKSEWRRDIRRHRALDAVGWITLHLTEEDLAPDARRDFIDDIRRAIASRTA